MKRTVSNENDLIVTASLDKAHALDMATGPWDKSYEWRSILLLSTGFGLVGYDRFLIFPMFPSIMVGLHLTYTDLGKITGVLAITYGLAAFISGRIADRFGRRRTIVVALVMFALLVGLSGLAVGALSLILIRALMGLAEGSYGPPSLVAALEAARPHRRGLAMGLYQVSASITGFALAPILVTQLMHVISWRYIFFLACPPGLILAVFIWRTIREPEEHISLAKSLSGDSEKFFDLFKHRNIWLASVAMFASLNGIVVLAAFLPSYFVDLLKLPIVTMGFIMAGLGLGSIIGSVGIPALSDRFGRKPSMIISAVGAIGTVTMLSRTGADPGLLFMWLMATSLFTAGLIGLSAGPVAVEAVPIHLRATATGTVIAIGEILGSGICPVAAGISAHRYGIATIFYLAIGGLVLGLISCLLLRETAPLKSPKDYAQKHAAPADAQNRADASSSTAPSQSTPLKPSMVRH